MKFIVKCYYFSSSAQKTRLIANLIRGKTVLKALDILKYINKKPVFAIKKLIHSLISNAKYNNNIAIEKLKIFEIFVNEGPVKKRFLSRAKGRVDTIMKRSSHITIIGLNYVNILGDD